MAAGHGLVWSDEFDADGLPDPAQWPFDRPQFLILNIAVGGHLGGEVDDRVFPVAMEVEHVRVDQPRP